ncbi:MAG: hypothetical protein Q8R60_14330 [Mycobacteriales bacterium]|nr:hypothetical protein [Mycobacteriales bacterium]
MGLLSRFRRPAVVADVRADDPGLVVVASSFDPAAADSAVVAASLADGRADPDRPVLLRHHLSGLEPRREALAELLDPSYALVGGEGRLLVQRSQSLTALGVAQERTRMAGLAQRLGGDALGWDALQAPLPMGNTS